MDPTLQPVSPEQPNQVIEQDPGRTLAIVGLIVGFVTLPLIGLILCLVARSRSRKLGKQNKVATVGIWIHSVLMVFVVLSILFIRIGG